MSTTPQTDKPSLIQYWVDEESPYIEDDVVRELINDAFQSGYETAVDDMDNKFMTRRAKHLLLYIRSGKFVSGYEYAKKHGISHQSVNETLKRLKRNGII